ncbi:MAG: hypothetical protein K5799_04870 [Erythrobacter sp.]|nr:hypothetical protein [Erythrobacter sp.]
MMGFCQLAPRTIAIRWLAILSLVLPAFVASPAAAQRAAGTPPTLSCPAGSVLFDWDQRAWTAGATSASYQIESIGTMSFSITNPNGVFLSASGLGLSGPTPQRQTAVNGGFTNQNSLALFVDLASRTARVTTTITLPAIMRGAQFRIFDVDFNANQFADSITVEGRYNGATVLPALTNGVTNYVSNNTAIGDGASDSASAAGNVVVTFSQSVDTIIISYGNAPSAPSNPGQQAISIFDIAMCRPTTSITTTKTNAIVSDPANGTSSPKFIPGAVVEYCILVNNAGDTAAQSIVATDTLPVTTTYIPGSLRSGATCQTATTVEDDDAVGADESDPYGASFAGGTVTATTPSLALGTGFAIKFRATVD